MKFMRSYHFLMQRMTNMFYSQISDTIRFTPVACFITHIYQILFYVSHVNTNKCL